MPHNQCPPSRRGHTWNKPSWNEPAIQGDPAIRICQKCGQLGRVNKQGVIYAMETAP
jgi:hypothetical protein